MNNQLIEYGKKGNSKELREILSHIFNRNNELSELEKKGTPICIWGTHGLGKTQIIRDYALEKKWKFSFSIWTIQLLIPDIDKEKDHLNHGIEI